MSIICIFWYFFASIAQKSQCPCSCAPARSSCQITMSVSKLL